MSNRHYPRVAIVSANPLRNDQANGIFLRSLFARWPRQQLSQIYFPVATTYLPDLECCREYRLIRLSGRVRRFHAPAAGGDALLASGWVGPNFPGFSNSPGWLSRVGRALLRRPRLFRWCKLIQEMWYVYSWIGKMLERELRKLRPEIVYAQFGNYWLTRITGRACERLGLPLYFQINDDFVHTQYADIPFGALIRSASETWARRVINYACGRAGASPILAEAYASRYGNDWSWFATLVEAGAYDPAPHGHHGPVQLVFAGNLGLQRWTILRQLALALQALRQELRLDTRLLIYTSPDQANAYRAALDVPPITEMRGWAAPGQLPAIFHDADLLVHVESFDPLNAAYTQLSLSTKISQYMMAGRCILAVGPEQVGSIQVIQRAQAGPALGEQDLPHLAAALRPVLEDAALRQRYGENGRRWALRWLEAESGRERFRQSLVEALHRFPARQAA